MQIVIPRNDYRFKKMDKNKIALGVRMILEGIGENPSRPGLIATPQRVAEMYEEILVGISLSATEGLTPFLPDEFNEMIIAKDITFFSICEHHLLPFFGKVHIAYIPSSGKMIGLSKLARLVEITSKRLQVQERLVTEIADTLVAALNPQGVLVIIEAEHLCMTMRGVKNASTLITTSAVRGVFEKEATRIEALSLIKK